MLDLEIFQNTFEQMYHRYEMILDTFRPSRKRVGFTEVNLTHNFIIALKDQFPKSDLVEWLEFPWGGDGRKRIDAIIFSKKDKWILFIEAKRFQSEKKVIKLNSDLSKIESFCHHEKFESIFVDHHGVDDIANYKHYIVALADVWTEEKSPDWKTNLPNYWIAPHTFPSEFQDCEQLLNLLKNGKVYSKASNQHKEYHLLCAIKQIIKG